MVNCCLCSSLKRKEEKEVESGSHGELARKYVAEGKVQGCKQIRGIGTGKSQCPDKATACNSGTQVTVLSTELSVFKIAGPNVPRPKCKGQVMKIPADLYCIRQLWA